MSGKGDKQRPTDHEKYSYNYDLIFGKKPATPILETQETSENIDLNDSAE
jgi:hypothetical protein